LRLCCFPGTAPTEKSVAATASPGVRGQLRRRAYAVKLHGSQPVRCNIGSTRQRRASKRAGMSGTKITAAENCADMPQVRRGVDAIDAALVELLAKRFAYMAAAARIKTNRDAIRDEDRKQTVIGNAAQAAFASGIPADVVTEIWEILVERSIAFELATWDRLQLTRV
jgi:isochorismate pyruvate lyase